MEGDHWPPNRMGEAVLSSGLGLGPVRVVQFLTLHFRVDVEQLGRVQNLPGCSETSLNKEAFNRLDSFSL